MAEDSGPQKPIKVRDLITAFESKVTTDFSRPRARSLGDVLSKNVTVRLHNLISLNDVEEELIKFVTKLNQYEIYNKEQHVALQNEIFTILTSIASIRSDSRDDDEKKSNLISNTKTFVSVLNKKLPSNKAAATNQYKYVTYEEFKLSKSTANGNTEGMTSVEANGDDSNSITKLGKRFEQSKGSKAVKKEHNKLYRSKSTTTPVAKEATNDTIDCSVPPEFTPSEVTITAVSVSKLRNLFEADRKSISQGLNAISRNEDFKYKVKIPYNGRREPVRTFQNSRSMSISNLVGRTSAKEDTTEYSLHKREIEAAETQPQTSSVIWTIQKNHRDNIDNQFEKGDPDSVNWTRTVERYQVKLTREISSDDGIAEDDVLGSNTIVWETPKTHQENLGEQFEDSVEYLDSGNWTSSLSCKPLADIKKSTQLTYTTDVLEDVSAVPVEDSGSGSDSVGSVETVISNVQ